MNLSEALWELGLLGLWIGAFKVFTSIRRRTPAFARGRQLKAELPPWVRLVETLALMAFAIACSLAVIIGFQRIYGRFHPGVSMAGAAAIYAVMAGFLIGVPAGCLIANAMSWLVPPIRKANLAAMSKGGMTFVEANRELVIVLAVMTPLALVQMAIALWQPWSR